jgi:hypothetical protein
MPAKQSVMTQRAIAQPTGNPGRKSHARITVMTRNGLRLRVETLEHQFEDSLIKLCDTRVVELYRDFGREDIYVFVNRT